MQNGTATPHKTSKSSTAIKFLCSYGGKILPRPSDGCLRYSGGYTRVLSVHRAISFYELMTKLSELCGYSVVLRCQLPSEDLDVLVSVKSDEDLANVIDEYDRASKIAAKDMKIRAILSPPRPLKTVSPSSSSSSSSSADLRAVRDRQRSYCTGAPAAKTPVPIAGAPAHTGYCGVRNRNYPPCHLQANIRPSYLAHNRSNHWQ